MAERKIDGDTYRVEKMAPLAAQRLLIRLGKMFGPTLGGLADVLSNPNEAERDRHGMELFGQFFVTLDEDDAERLLVDLVSQAAIQEPGGYAPVVFDHHIQDISTAWKIAYLVVETQFGDFFGDARAAGQNIGAALGRRSSASTK